MQRTVTAHDIRIQSYGSASERKSWPSLNVSLRMLVERIDRACVPGARCQMPGGASDIVDCNTMEGVNRAVDSMIYDSSAYTQLGAPYTVRGLLRSDASDME